MLSILRRTRSDGQCLPLNVHCRSLAAAERTSASPSTFFVMSQEVAMHCNTSPGETEGPKLTAVETSHRTRQCPSKCLYVGLWKESKQTFTQGSQAINVENGSRLAHGGSQWRPRTPGQQARGHTSAPANVNLSQESYQFQPHCPIVIQRPDSKMGFETW